MQHISFINTKREYIVIPIIHIGGILLHLKQKQPYLSLYWQKYNRKIFNQKRIQKEKYEMKNKNNQ